MCTWKMSRSRRRARRPSVTRPDSSRNRERWMPEEGLEPPTGGLSTGFEPMALFAPEATASAVEIAGRVVFGWPVEQVRVRTVARVFRRFAVGNRANPQTRLQLRQARERHGEPATSRPATSRRSFAACCDDEGASWELTLVVSAIAWRERLGTFSVRWRDCPRVLAPRRGMAARACPAPNARSIAEARRSQSTPCGRTLPGRDPRGGRNAWGPVTLGACLFEPGGCSLADDSV
jgi:hypothetical protein